MPHHLIPLRATIHLYALDAWDRLAQQMDNEEVDTLLVSKNEDSTFAASNVHADGTLERRVDSALLASAVRAIHSGLYYHRYPYKRTVIALHKRRWMLCLGAVYNAWNTTQPVLSANDAVLLVPGTGAGAHTTLARMSVGIAACTSPGVYQAAHAVSPNTDLMFTPHLD